LENSFRDYFDQSFEEISVIELIEDDKFRDSLQIAQKFIDEEDYRNAIIVIKVVFEWGILVFNTILPEEGFNSSFFVASDLDDISNSGKIKGAIEKIYERIKDTEKWGAYLSTGVDVKELKRFESITPHISFAMPGNWHAISFDRHEFSHEDTIWAFDFVIETILKLQEYDLNPVLSDHYERGYQQIKELVKD
jgi:hypothetical protein